MKLDINIMPLHATYIDTFLSGIISNTNIVAIQTSEVGITLVS
jgi:hypothetical protein